MDVCFNGFGENVLTFIASGTINAGDPVMISANGTVVKASHCFNWRPITDFVCSQTHHLSDFFFTVSSAAQGFLPAV